MFNKDPVISFVQSYGRDESVQAHKAVQDADDEARTRYCHEILNKIDAYHDPDSFLTNEDKEEVTEALGVSSQVDIPRYHVKTTTAYDKNVLETLIERDEASTIEQVPPHAFERTDEAEWVYENQDTGTQIVYEPDPTTETLTGGWRINRNDRLQDKIFSMTAASETPHDEHTALKTDESLLKETYMLQGEEADTFKAVLEQYGHTDDGFGYRVNGNNITIEPDHVFVTSNPDSNPLWIQDRLPEMEVTDRHFEGDGIDEWIKLTGRFPPTFKEQQLYYSTE